MRPRLAASAIALVVLSLVPSAQAAQAATIPVTKLRLTAESLTEDAARVQQLGVMRGALVDSVGRRGPAERAGLQEGDVIIAVGSMPIADALELDQAVEAAPSGTRVMIQYVRGGVTAETTAKLAESE